VHLHESRKQHASNPSNAEKNMRKKRNWGREKKYIVQKQHNQHGESPAGEIIRNPD